MHLRVKRLVQQILEDRIKGLENTNYFLARVYLNHRSKANPPIYYPTCFSSSSSALSKANRLFSDVLS